MSIQRQAPNCALAHGPVPKWSRNITRNAQLSRRARVLQSTTPYLERTYLFELRQHPHLLICRTCKDCVRPLVSALTIHTPSRHHKWHPDTAVRWYRRSCVRRPAALPNEFPAVWMNPTESLIPVSSAPTSPQSPRLSLHRGLRCCQCLKIVTALPYAGKTMSKHC